MFQSYNEEPEADWFTTDSTRFGNTIRLDGGSTEGWYTYYAQMYRNTEHWKSYLIPSANFPKYQADLGFIVKNNHSGTLLSTSIKITIIKNMLGVVWL